MVVGLVAVSVSWLVVFYEQTHNSAIQEDDERNN